MADASRLRSSTAVSDSNPSSLKARSGRMPSAVMCPSTATACVVTRSVSKRSWSGSGRSASDCRSSDPEPADPAAVSAEDANTARTSGSSASSGLGRTAVNSGTKRCQSISATATKVSSWSSACCRAATASSGAISGRPCPRTRRRVRSTSRSPRFFQVLTASSQTPQATDTIGRPPARPCSARASSAALAAA